MKFFDTHCHIGLIHDDPIEQLIIVQEARQEKVEHIISICNNINDFNKLYNDLAMATNVYHAVGVSPTEVNNIPSDWEYKLEQAVKLDRVVAIGETGLDYDKYGNHSQQVELFCRHLELADKYNLPVIIHNRQAGEVILEILQNKMPSKGVLFHCYSADKEFAKRAMEFNTYFSFAGNVTYRKTKHLFDTAAYLPLDRVLVESEAPFIVPAIYKGKRNKPAYLGETVKHLAKIRNMEVEELAAILYSNSLKFFGIDE